jgi:hypothetical protein
MSAGLSTAAMIRAASTIFSLESKTYQNLAFQSMCKFLGSNIPGLANVNDIDSIWASLPEVRFHMNLQVLGSEVALSAEKHLNVLGSRIKNGRKI